MPDSGIAGSSLRILLAGGIGSGKSAVASLLAEQGALVIDADRLGRSVLEPGAEAFDAVTGRWPQVVVDDRIDRACLASIVFGDADALAELEGISHPAIVARIRALVDAAGTAPVVVEVPVIITIDGGGWVRVFVDAPPDLRVERVTARGGDPADTRRRMEAQPSRSEWLAWADRVLVNAGSKEELNSAVDDLWRDLTGAGR
jgi:dephospho-CoA kinase